MRSMEFSGRNIDEAIFHGLNEMGLTIDEVDTEIVQKESKGLFGIGAKDRIEPDKPCVLSEKNKQRFEVEDILRDIIFVDRDYMGWQYDEKSYSLRRRKILLKKRIENDPRDFSRVLKTYVQYADVKDELQGELLKRTIGMYKD